MGAEPKELRGLLVELREELRKLRHERSAPLPKAYKRREAMELMKVGPTKLKGLIRSQAILTCEDPGLIPRSEVDRYLAAKESPGSRPVRNGRPPSATVPRGKQEASKARAMLRRKS